MEYRKGTLKLELSESLRTLMLRRLFSKITIKQICDETGVIRATFYNYFDDKYDCLNYVVYHDIQQAAEPYLERGNLEDALTAALTQVEKNREFYRIAYDVTGQNSFEDMIRDNLRQCFLKYLKDRRKRGYLEKYSNDLLARYYADSMEFFFHYFIFDRNNHTVKDIVQMTVDLMNSMFADFSVKH